MINAFLVILAMYIYIYIYIRIYEILEWALDCTISNNSFEW